MQIPAELTDIVLEDPLFDQKVIHGSEAYHRRSIEFFEKNRKQLDKIRQTVESKYPEIHVVVLGSKKVLGVYTEFSDLLDIDEDAFGHPIYMLDCNETFETDGGQY